MTDISVIKAIIARKLNRGDSLISEIAMIAMAKTNTNPGAAKHSTRAYTV